MEDYTLLTPENVELRYDVAGVGSRVVAAAIDYLVVIAAWTILLLGGMIAAGIASAGADLLGGSAGDVASFAALALIVLLTFFLWWGYFVLFEMLWNGQSIGKRAMRLRVVRTAGQPIGLGASLVRNLLRAVDGFFWIGVLVMLIDARSRRLGDFAAGTLVVQEPRKLGLDERGIGRTIEVPGVAPEQVELLPNADRLTAAHYTLLRDYFARRARLPAPASGRLARNLAADLARALAVPSAEVGDPTAFLAAATRAYEARHRFDEPAADPLR